MLGILGCCSGRFVDYPINLLTSFCHHREIDAIEAEVTSTPPAGDTALLQAEKITTLPKRASVMSRPIASDDYPILPLLEPINQLLDPPKAMLDDTLSLLKILGMQNYDARFMAISRPDKTGVLFCLGVMSDDHKQL